MSTLTELPYSAVSGDRSKPLVDPSQPIAANAGQISETANALILRPSERIAIPDMVTRYFEDTSRIVFDPAGNAVSFARASDNAQFGALGVTTGRALQTAFDPATGMTIFDVAPEGNLMSAFTAEYWEGSERVVVNGVSGVVAFTPIRPVVVVPDNILAAAMDDFWEGSDRIVANDNGKVLAYVASPLKSGDTPANLLTATLDEYWEGSDRIVVNADGTVIGIIQPSSGVSDPASGTALTALSTRVGSVVDQNGAPVSHLMGARNIREFPRLRDQLLYDSVTLTMHMAFMGDSYTELGSWLRNQARAWRVELGNGGPGWTGFGFPSSTGFAGIGGNVDEEEVLVAMSSATVPAKVFNFTSTTESWGSVNSTLAWNSNGTITQTPTATDPQIGSPAINIVGLNIRYIRARVRPLGATPTFDGTIYYSTASHGYGAFSKSLTNPGLAQNSWIVLEWDMANLTGGASSDYLSSIITNIRIDLGAGTDAWEIDWITMNAQPADGGVITNGAGTAGTGWVGSWMEAEHSPDACAATTSTAGDRISLFYNSSKYGTATITAVKLFFLGGSGISRYRFNNGAWTTLNLSGSGGQAVTIATPPIGNTWALDWDHVSGTGVYHGATLLTGAKGIVIHDLAVSGSDLYRWSGLAVANPADWRAKLAAGMARLGKISTFVVPIGTNDQTYSHSYDSYQTGMAAWIDEVGRVASPGADVLWICAPENGRDVANFPQRMAGFTLVAKAVALTKDIALLDMQSVFGRTPTEYGYGGTLRELIGPDFLHPNDAGGATYRSCTRNALTYRS